MRALRAYDHAVLAMANRMGRSTEEIAQALELLRSGRADIINAVIKGTMTLPGALSAIASAHLTTQQEKSL